MAERFDLVTPDIKAPETAYPYGSYLDEGAGDPGSPILANWKNSIKAFFERIMVETGRAWSGVADSVTVSQFFDSFIEMVTGRDSSIVEWSAGTYNQDDVVIYGGKQWFVGVASTIETPGPNSEWELSEPIDNYLTKQKDPELGGLLPLCDIRDLTNYAEYFREGKHTWNGADWETWRINVDGSAHVSGTSDIAKLIAAAKYGASIVFSDTAGTLTLKDYQGMTAAALDASGGKRADLSDGQDDAMQKLTGEFSRSSTVGSLLADAVLSGVFIQGSGYVSKLDVSAGAAFGVGFDSSQSPGAKTDDDETWMKNFSQGSWGLILVVPAGTV